MMDVSLEEQEKLLFNSYNEKAADLFGCNK